jgi:hypothetical protein
MYVYTTYRSPLSVQAQYSRSCPIISSSWYNSSLVTWTVVCLTAAKSKPLTYISCVGVRLVQCCEHELTVWFGFSLCSLGSDNSTEKYPLPSNGYMLATYKTPLATLVLLLYLQRRWIAMNLSEWCLHIRCGSNMFTEPLPRNVSTPFLVAYSLRACLPSRPTATALHVTIQRYNAVETVEHQSKQRQAYSSTLKMEATISSETSA